MPSNIIDIGFDFRADSNGGDPDAKSPTLRRYHRMLWSKALPCGKILLLDEKLRHNSEIGSFSFGSDSIIHTFSRWIGYQHIIRCIPQAEIDEFMHEGYTIGGMLIFPNYKINNKQTINGARGCNAKIKDRFDLTLECIRRYYINEPSPLYEVFKRYDDFFNLFVDFKGYVDFFLLQDLVTPDYRDVLFLHPFNDFDTPPLPADVSEYQQYKTKSLSLIKKRNIRIKKWVEENL